MAKTSGQTLFRTAMLTVVTAVLIAMSARPASANQSGPDVEAANALASLCGWMGGTAGVLPIRTVGSGLRAVHVVCHGGGLNGLGCLYHKKGQMCGFIFSPAPNSDPVFEPVGEIEPTDPSIVDAPQVGTAVEAESGDEGASEPVDGAEIVDEPVVDPAPQVDESTDPGPAGPVVNGQDVTADTESDPLPEVVDDDLPTLDETVEPVSDGEIVADPVVGEPVVVEDVAVAAPSGGGSPEIMEVEESES